MIREEDDLKFDIIDGFDFTIEEKANQYTVLRKVQWSKNDKPYGSAHLEIRKCFLNKSGNETIGKGCGFLTEDGPHELVKVLIENDYGKTVDVINGIKNRGDFIPSLAIALSIKELSKVKDTTGIEIEHEDGEDEEYFNVEDMI